MSNFSDTADFRWNQACIVDLEAGKFPIWRVGGGGLLRKICSLWYNLTKKVVFLTVAGFGIFGPHKILDARPRGLPHGTALLVATEVPHDPHMAVHALEDQPEGTGHLVVQQCGGPAWRREHVTALRSWASTIAGAEIRLHDHPAIRPGDTRALSVDQLTPSHPDVRWHSADLSAG